MSKIPLARNWYENTKKIGVFNFEKLGRKPIIDQEILSKLIVEADHRLKRAQLIEDLAYETYSYTSMDTTSSNPLRFHGIELEYDAKITYFRKNNYGVKIYKDFMNHYVVKKNIKH